MPGDKLIFFKEDLPEPPPPQRDIKLPPGAAIVVAALLVLAVFGGLIRRLRRRRTFRRGPGRGLGRALLNLSPVDVMTVRHLLNSVVILGRTGSGKTSSSGLQLGRAILRLAGGGMLVLAAKLGEDFDLWREIARSAGREDDFLIFGPGSSLRFNFLDYVQKAGGDTREIARCISVIGETLRTADRKGGEYGDFWEKEAFRQIYNGVEIVKLATGSVNSWDLQRFIGGMAQSNDELSNPKWRSGYHCQLIYEAEKNVGTGTARFDLDRAKDYWLSEMPLLNDRTRSSITVHVMGLLHVFNTGIVRELVSTTTNVTPEVMLQGKCVLVNMPPAEYGDSGNFVNAGWKYLTQRMILRRHAKGDDPVHAIWCDEFQQHVNSYDAHYLTQCRSHRGCLIALTQSIHGLFATLKGQAGQHEAKLLLTNFGTKILHALGSAEDADFASRLIGMSRQTFIGGSSGPPGDLWDGMLGRNVGFSSSFNEQLAPIIDPGAFINGLRTGGPESGLECDAIVVRSGEPFAWGENWLPVTFSQR